ncbi:MAG TPA: ATP-grasp domain-containing protein [Streptosporangiaceae bacterium]
MSKHVMVFGSGNGDLPSRIRALEEGVATTLVCRLDHLGRLVEPERHARLLVLSPGAGLAECVGLARAVHAVHPVTHIATLGEHDQDRAAAVGEALGVYTHSQDTVRLAFHKDEMRARLRDLRLDDTPAQVVPDLAALREFAQENGYPLVVKPVGGLASFGVSVVREEHELAGAFRRADTSAEHGWHASLGVLAERYLDGPEISVEAISEAAEHVVLAVTAKYTDQATRVEVGHVLPAPLAAGIREQAEQLACSVLDAIGVEFGATHTEMVLTPAGPRVIETHVRMGGDEIWELVQAVTGVDLIDAQLRQSVGQKVLPQVRETLAVPRAPRAAAIWFATPPAAGELVEVTGADHDPEISVLVPPGTVFSGLVSSYSRPAAARCAAPTAAQAVALARQKVGRLSFLTRVPALRHADSVPRGELCCH